MTTDLTKERKITISKMNTTAEVNTLNFEERQLLTYDQSRLLTNFDSSEPLVTDQSFANSCDINNIMEMYAKTGMLPNQTIIPAKFIDNTGIPSLEEAFNIVNTAVDAFYELPAPLRKLMDNDPSKLESFIADEDNRDSLIKYGVLVEQPKPKEPTDSTLSKVKPPENTDKV